MVKSPRIQAAVSQTERCVHEREDVIKHRESFLKSISDLRKAHKPPPLCSDDAPHVRQQADEDKKVLMLVYHNESIYNTNEGQTLMWAEEDHPAILAQDKRQRHHGFGLH